MKSILAAILVIAIVLFCAKAGPCEDLQKDNILENIFVNPADDTFSQCIDTVKQRINKGIDSMKEIYNSLTLEMESIKQQNQDLKSDIVNALDQISDRKDEETKFIIMDIKRQIIEADRDCEGDRIVLLKKADEIMKKKLGERIKLLNEKVDFLNQEKQKLNDMIKGFQDTALKCQTNLTQASKIYNDKIQALSQQIENTINSFNIEKAQKRKIDKAVSTSCLSALQTFLQKAEPPVEKEAPDFFSDDFRLSQFHPADAPALSLTAYYRLYLIGKIINVEIFYKEMIPGLEEKKLKAEELFNKIKQQTEKAEKRAGSISVYEKLVASYQEFTSGYRKSLEQISNHIKDISINLNNIETTRKDLVASNTGLAISAKNADKAQQLACKNAQDKLQELLEKLNALEGKLKDSLEDLKIQQSQTRIRAEFSEKLGKRLEDEFRVALDKVVDRMHNINYSKNSNYKEEHDKVFVSFELKNAHDKVTENLATCIMNLEKEDLEIFNKELTTKHEYVREWMQEISGKSIKDIKDD